MGKRRVGFMVVASWVLATVFTGLVVWSAVAVLDDGTRTQVLSGAQVSGLLASASSAPSTAMTPSTAVTLPSVTPTAQPTTATPSTTAPSVPASPTKSAATATTTKVTTPSASPVARTWTVTGGVVATTCTGATISLLYATPSDGWRVTIDKSGPTSISLEFASGERETKVRGTCVAGVPQQSSSDHD